MRMVCGRFPQMLTLACVAVAMSHGPGAAQEGADANAMLLDLAGRFSWAPITAGACVVQIQLTGDPGGSWHVVPLDGGDVDLRPGPDPDAGFTCELDLPTLVSLYDGELNGITAAGKDDVALSSPLEVLPGTAVPEDAGRESLAPVFHFLAHFFNRTAPERIQLSRDAARPLHGAQMVGLYYHPGFRSAWYSLQGSERLNGDGDTTPYAQAFTVMRGQARVFLGGRACDVDEGEVIYIPAGIMHAVESRDGSEVELLWMAWGSGA